MLNHICGENDHLNKIKSFLLMIFAEMSDNKQMLLPE